jgi:hypothetical protein
MEQEYPIFWELRVIGHCDYINPSFHLRHLLSTSSPVFPKSQSEKLDVLCLLWPKNNLRHSHVLQQFHNPILYPVMGDSVQSKSRRTARMLLSSLGN